MCGVAERHVRLLQSQPLLSSDSTTLESASLDEDEGGSQATPGDNSGGNGDGQTLAHDGSIAERGEEGEGEETDEEGTGSEKGEEGGDKDEQPEGETESEGGSDGEEGGEKKGDKPLEATPIAEPEPEVIPDTKGQADVSTAGNVAKPVSSLTRLFLSRLYPPSLPLSKRLPFFHKSASPPLLPPLPQAPPPKTAPSSASLASSATPEADPPLPLLEAPAPLPSHVFFVPKPKHQPGLAWIKASPPEHIVSVLARTFPALQEEGMQEARAEAAGYAVAAQKTELQALIHATVCIQLINHTTADDAQHDERESAGGLISDSMSVCCLLLGCVGGLCGGSVCVAYGGRGGGGGACVAWPCLASCTHGTRLQPTTTGQRTTTHMKTTLLGSQA